MSWNEQIALNDVMNTFDTSDLRDWDPLPEGFLTAVKEECKKSQIISRHHVMEWLDECKTIGQFNRWLDFLYALADTRRVWLGGFGK